MVNEFLEIEDDMFGFLIRIELDTTLPLPDAEVTEENRMGHIRLVSIPSMGNISSFNDLTHEAIHIALGVGRIVGFDFSTDKCDEFVTYYAAWIVEKVIELSEADKWVR
jgi:hypothetical protein